VPLETEAVVSGIYEQAALQPKASSVNGGSCDLHWIESTSANKPVDSQLIGFFSRKRHSECLALLMKLRAPSCREFHLAALTRSLAPGSATIKKESRFGRLHPTGSAGSVSKT
jgi:hypothetical protein